MRGVKHEPTSIHRAAVLAMAQCGVPQDCMAQALGVSARTLRLRYREELDLGLEIANARVSMALYTLAVSGKCPAATMFWLKCRAGWRETGRLQLEASNLSDTDLRAHAAQVLALNGAAEDS